jgi:hypothetical protein
LKDREPEANVEPGQSWEVDFFRPEDGPGVVRLFRVVYGDDYPIKTFMDPQRLVEENAARRTLSSVARTPKGDIVGHVALVRSAPFERLFESASGAVLPAYRRGSMATELLAHGPKVAAEMFGVEVIFGEPVCNHVGTQKISSLLGWVSYALEVDLMPAEAYAKEKSAVGRVSVLTDFKELRCRPQKVYLPGLYEKQLEPLYPGSLENRESASSSAELPGETGTRIETQFFDFAKVARMAVQEAGADFEPAFKKEEESALGRGAVVIQVWVKLSWPWVGEVVERLRACGYFIGGALPRWFDGDGLLMQKTTGRPHWEGIQLFTDRAREILDFVREDWAGLQGGR